MNQRDEALYLKHYVKQRPDNQMAWYLLGRQYLELGKEAKANYCFLKAGEIYEAFERKRHPIVDSQIAARERKLAAEAWFRRRARRARRLRSALALLLLGAALFALPLSARGPDTASEAQPAVAAREGAAGVARENAANDAGHDTGNDTGYDFADDTSRQPPGAAGASGDAEQVFIAYAPGRAGSEDGEESRERAIGAALSSLLQPGRVAGRGIAAELEQSSGYRLWPGGAAARMAVNFSPEHGTATVSYYDAALCRCEPEDGAEANALLASYAQSQEQLWVLMSAMHQFHADHQRWPEQLEELAAPYPYNYLAGEGSEMAAMFAPLATHLKQQYGNASAGDQGGKPLEPQEPADRAFTAMPALPISAEGGLGQAVSDLPQQPLEIIIDKQHYRLGLISGDVLIRSYPVGLGGSRTPEGSFRISEKVRNPNGKPDGEFGSRGMQLSDTQYAIHGTNHPASIGADDSLGCIRLHPAHIEELYDLVPLGTKITIASNVLPAQLVQPAAPFSLAPRHNEEHAGHIYRWLQ